MMRFFYSLMVFILAVGCIHTDKHSVKTTIRNDVLLNEGWVTIANDSSKNLHKGFELKDFDTKGWKITNLPHNWDDYGGYRRLKHGNKHGYAWYRRSFLVDQKDEDKRYFLWFEGVGSYATVWVNGDSVGFHAGGRTSFTLDITQAVQPGEENLLAVRADHPPHIRDLPWVCGGCSPEWGFSEGSQPLGIFRPVHLVVTNPIRIEPFGIHIWNDPSISRERAALHISTEVKNYGSEDQKVTIVNTVRNRAGAALYRVQSVRVLQAGRTDTIRHLIPEIRNPRLWFPDDPYLYPVETSIVQGGKIVDRVSTPYGIRWIKWDIEGDQATNRFYINGEPVFINGICEYEHAMGHSHAFTEEQIAARVSQIKAAGFNAFRDAHQPHNLRYQEYWDEQGILWWPQMAAHIWFDTPAFRMRFKLLLHDWIKERRNSPSVILWGLENESTLPTGFAEECTELIRKLDPTASSQRLVTTCNGGTGTDWNVIQNWSGTYGGDPERYAEELSDQLLNGEYGAWRSLGLHTEGGYVQNGPLSEDRMVRLLESKIRRAESVNDRCCGQFLWLFNSHDNPGRVQSGEGSRGLDRIGPVNYKGLFTIWGEPLDAYYMYRANYAPRDENPMVYIAMHTWPDRWISTGVKSGISVYSNCDEVHLYNGLGSHSLGVRTKKGIGTHFEWDQVKITNPIIQAVGIIDGKKVATDVVRLHHLPVAGKPEKQHGREDPLIQSSRRNYLYLVNCGGPDYTDQEGNLWLADVRKTEKDSWGSVSWTDNDPNLPAFYGSQRQSMDPVEGTHDQKLFQNFRYGRDQLQYSFPVPNGMYRIELFFTEPWYGTGGGLDCRGWRIFDVAVNEITTIDDLDIWMEAGHDKVLKKTFDAQVDNGELILSFPEVKAGQAIISAIAISTENPEVVPAPPSKGVISGVKTNPALNEEKWQVQTWMDTGINQYSDTTGAFYMLPPEFYGAEWIRPPVFVKHSKHEVASFQVRSDSYVYIALSETIRETPEWLRDFISLPAVMKSTYDGSTCFRVFRREVKKGDTVFLYGPGGPAEKTPMYSVVVLPVTSLDDPIDLRQSVSYDALSSGCTGQTKPVEYLDKEGVFIPDPMSSLEWIIHVGLASKYGLEFRYVNERDTVLRVTMEIISADGREIGQRVLDFLPSGKKWQSHRTDTQTIINAGTYTLRITPKDNSPLYIDWLKVQ